MARLASTAYPLPAPEYGTPIAEWSCHAEFARLVEVSDELAPGEVVGGMLRWPVADGYAHYLVTSDAPLTVQHVAYLDAWTVDPSLIRGLDRDSVVQMLDRERRMRDLFNR